MNKRENIITDADRMRAELKARGLSQRAAAKLLDINERTMRRYCSGRYPIPSMVWLALESINKQRSNT